MVFGSLLKGWAKTTTEPAPTTVEGQIVSELVKEITDKKSLVTSPDTSDRQIESLRTLDSELALLELIKDEDSTHILSRLIRDAITAEGEDLASCFAELRELEEPEIRYFLALAARLDISPEFRKEAVGALLAQASGGEKEFLQTLFRDSRNEEVRQAAVYAFEPADSPELRQQLLATFNDMSPRLRRSTVELLAPYREEPDVQTLITSGKLNSEERRSLR